MLVEAFSTYQRTRGFSENTIRRRELSVAMFARFIAPMPLAAATTELIDEWLGTFASPRTRHAYRSDVRVFYTWASKRNLVDGNPAEDVDRVKVPKSLPRPVPAEAVAPVIDAADGWLRVALALAAYAGLRCAEACSLTMADIDRHRGVLTVRNGKGGRDRTVPLHPALVVVLDELHPRPGQRLVPVRSKHVGAAASAHLRRLGLPHTIHNLRATFATSLARATNGNLVVVAEALGHESVQTTVGYVRLGGSDQLRAAVAAMDYGAA